MKKFTLFLVVAVLSVLMASTVENVTAVHTSFASSSTWTSEVCKRYVYVYYVENNSTEPADDIVQIVISKSPSAEVGLNRYWEPQKGWGLTTTDGSFKITSKDFAKFYIAPGKNLTFLLYSTMEPKPGTLFTIDRKLGQSPTHNVWVPDDKERPGNAEPQSHFITPNRYTFTLSYVSGNVYHLDIYLHPLVTIESVTTSDPEWYYHRYTTGYENGLLVFKTDTKPVNSTNPMVSISFDAPNSVPGQVDVMTYGFAGNLTGPEPPPPVGGYSVPIDIPVDKFGLSALYIALVSTILVATAATAIYVKRVKHRKEKQ